MRIASSSSSLLLAPTLPVSVVALLATKAPSLFLFPPRRRLRPPRKYMHRKEAASETLSNPLPSSPPLSPLPPSLSLLCCAAGEEGSFLLLSRLLQKEFPSHPPLPWHAPPLKRRRRRRRRTAFPLEFPPFFGIPPRLSSSHRPRVMRPESGGKRDGASFFPAHYRCFVWEMHC